MEALVELAPSRALADTTVTLTFDSRCKSRQRVQLDDGRAAALFLERGHILRGGDRLRAESGLVVVVVAAAEPVTTVSAPDGPALARACYHLGNRHMPVQIGDGWLRISPDHVLEDLLRHLGLSPRSEEAPFEPEAGAYAGHSHGHHHAAAQG